MQYYVIAPDGQKYGPVDVPTLNQWAQDRRVAPSSALETTDGQRVSASAVPGLVFPPQAAAPGPPSAGPGMGPVYGAPNYGPGYAPYPHQGLAMDNGQQDVTKAWDLGALGLLCCPVIFSTMGIVYGNNAAKKGHPQGKIAMYFSIVTLVLGIAVGVILNRSMHL